MGIKREELEEAVKWGDPYNEDLIRHKTLLSIIELHSEAKAEPVSYCKGCSVLGVLTIEWPCPTITVIDRMMK